MNRLKRPSAVAVTCTAILVAAGLADAGTLGRPEPSTVRSVAPLVVLVDGSGLTGPRSPAALPRATQLAPTGVPPEVARLAARVLPNPPSLARFPVAGPFNWGQEGARFGAARGGRAHSGQDVFGRTGTPLVAVRDGVVVARGDDGGRGNYVAILDPAARRTYVYLHMQRPAEVRPGQVVRAGQRVGRVGCTGSCFGDHLHFEIRAGRGPDGEPSDPLPELRRWARSSGAAATLPPGAH